MVGVSQGRSMCAIPTDFILIFLAQSTTFATLLTGQLREVFSKIGMGAWVAKILS